MIGEIVVGTGAKPIDVAPLRQFGGIDLDHRSDHVQPPIRPHGSDAFDEIEIHTFVDHSEEAEFRGSAAMSQAARTVTARAAKMGRVHAAGKQMRVGAGPA